MSLVNSEEGKCIHLGNDKAAPQRDLTGADISTCIYTSECMIANSSRQTSWLIYIVDFRSHQTVPRDRGSVHNLLLELFPCNIAALSQSPFACTSCMHSLKYCSDPLHDTSNNAVPLSELEGKSISAASIYRI